MHILLLVTSCALPYCPTVSNNCGTRKSTHLLGCTTLYCAVVATNIVAQTHGVHQIIRSSASLGMEASSIANIENLQDYDILYLFIIQNMLTSVAFVPHDYTFTSKAGP